MEITMIKLIVRVVGIEKSTGSEVVLYRTESDQYSPDQLEALVKVSLGGALQHLNATSLDALRAWCPEVSIVLTADDETVRPSLHLTQDMMNKLTEAGASFDFDPYV
jgi:hypothetical protein